MTKENSQMNPVVLAVSAAGGRKNLAQALRPPVSRQAVESWLKKGEIPAKRVPDVARVTGIPKRLLSPLFS